MSQFELCCKLCGSVNVDLKPTRGVDLANIMIHGICHDCGKGGIIPQSDGMFIMPFGKHRGLTIQEICFEHPQYADWVINTSDIKDDIKEKFLLARGHR